MEGDQENANTGEIVPGSWRTDEATQAWGGFQKLKGNTSSKAAKYQREYLKAYFRSPAGSVWWQDNMI